MSFRHARATRRAAAYLLFTVALLVVPKADDPETPFDEGNPQANEMVVVKAASSREPPQSVRTFVPRISAQPRWIIASRRMLSVHAGQFTDSRTFRELLRLLRC